MQPIVNGLEEEFGGTVTFAYINAITSEGQAQLHGYGLRGHPSYVLLSAEGEILWSMAGQTTLATLREQLARLP